MVLTAPASKTIGANPRTNAAPQAVPPNNAPRPVVTNAALSPDAVRYVAKIKFLEVKDVQPRIIIQEEEEERLGIVGPP